jgi:hypothetical protein
MCYRSYREAVEKEVYRRVEGREMFTAWDITCAVRAEGVVESHRVLREVVRSLHRYGQMGHDYERTFIAVEDGPTHAYLYHHRADDPCDYGMTIDNSDDSNDSDDSNNRYDLSKLVPVAKRGLLDTLLNRVRSSVNIARLP